MNRNVTIGAHRALVEACRAGTESQVELRDRGVTAVAQGPVVLMGEHVTVGTAVRCMAGGAPFYPGRRVLEHKRPILVRMTLAAHGLLKTAKPHAGAGRVRVVAGHAGDRALRQAVTFVESELYKRVLMAGIARRRGRIQIAQRMR